MAILHLENINTVDISINDLKFLLFIQFKFESCKFKVQKSKEGTGRIVMWNMGIMNSYTMEVCFKYMSFTCKKKNISIFLYLVMYTNQ